LALFELMKRHVRSRITLLDLARLIPGNELFTGKDIERLGGLSGQTPPWFWLYNEVYFVKMLPIPWDGPGPAYGVYIVLNLSTGSKEALLAALRGEPAADLENMHVLDLELSKIGPSGNMPP
jgi:hypothetical protein